MYKLSILTSALLAGSAALAYSVNPQPDPLNPGGFIMSADEIKAAEAAKTADPMYAIWADALRTRPNSVVEAITVGNPDNPENVQRLERVFPESEWDFLTRMAHEAYTYQRFLQAVGKFPAFCGEYTDGRDSDAICKLSVVTAFAHFAQETGGHIAIDNSWDNPHGLYPWQQALVHVREMNWSEGQPGYSIGCGQNDWQNNRWPCSSVPSYFGRGAKQLSYHFNYGAFSEAMFDGDATVLLEDPALVADTWLNLASAIWFFLTPQAPKPAMLHVLDRTWVPSQAELDAGIGYGFGTTINIINGGIECGYQNKDKGQPVNRISYWEALAEHYDLPIAEDEKNTCYQQTPYGSLNLEGAEGVLYTNWEAEFQYFADRPGGMSFECKLVGYQTAYSALEPGGYEKCITDVYGALQNWPEIRIVSADEIVVPTAVPSDSPTPGIPSWTAAAVYNKGDQVSHKGAIYQANWWTQGDEPGEDDAWTLVSDSGASPTVTPSVTPSATPSTTPSATPSTTPSATPSLTPSVSPSLTPSVSPSVTTTPSLSPTPSTPPVVNPPRSGGIPWYVILLALPLAIRRR